MAKKLWFRVAVYVAASVMTVVLPAIVWLVFYHGWIPKTDTFPLTVVPGAQDLSGGSNLDGRVFIEMSLDEFIARLAKGEIDEVWRAVTISDDEGGSSCVESRYYGERRGLLPFYAKEKVMHPKPEGRYLVAGSTRSVKGNEVSSAYAYNSENPFILAVVATGLGIAGICTIYRWFRRRT